MSSLSSIETFPRTSCLQHFRRLRHFAFAKTTTTTAATATTDTAATAATATITAITTLDTSKHIVNITAGNATTVLPI